MKYINIAVANLVFSFTNDLVEFNSFEFTTIENNGNVKVAIRIGYKANNPAFEYDLKKLEYIYGKDAVEVTGEEEDLKDPF